MALEPSQSDIQRRNGQHGGLIGPEDSLVGIERLHRAVRTRDTQPSQADAVIDWNTFDLSPITHAPLFGAINPSLTGLAAMRVQQRAISIARHLLEPQRLTQPDFGPDAVVAQESSPFQGRLTGPMQVFRRLMELWRLTDEQATTLLGLESRGMLKDLFGGAVSLRGRDAKDRIAYLFMIHDALAQLFHDEAATESAWLREHKERLGNRSPLDVMLEGSMASLLLVKQYVEHVSGR